MICNVYFSGRGTTKRYAEAMAEGTGKIAVSYDWRKQEERIPLTFSHDDLLLFSMPVYGGFIPRFTAELIPLLKGSSTPAVILAVYGNRDYDDALIQMRDLLEKQGFAVKAAGAVVAEHSIFPTVASGRPDDNDINEVKDFAAHAVRTIKEDGEPEIPGRKDWDSSAFKGTPFHPEADGRCTGCLTCVKACPVSAISKTDPRHTDAERCISCGACIISCPAGARGYWKKEYEEARASFESKCSIRRENIFWL